MKCFSVQEILNIIETDSGQKEEEEVSDQEHIEDVLAMNRKTLITTL